MTLETTSVRRTARARRALLLVALAGAARAPLPGVGGAPTNATAVGRRSLARRTGTYGGCASRRAPPGPPPLPALATATYAAAFPGGGDVTAFVEAVTGLRVGEAAASPSRAKVQALRGAGLAPAGGEEDGAAASRGQGQVVAVRTSFPHTAGKLASWDASLPRAVVVLRNPLHAIPAYFDRVYETRNHLPTGHAARPAYADDARAVWVRWRGEQLQSQIALYRRFVSFWMEKYLADEGARVYFAYEDLVAEASGPGEAERLRRFLEKGLAASAMDWVMGEMEARVARGGAGVGPDHPLFPFLHRGLSPAELIDEVIRTTTASVAPAEEVPCLWQETVRPAGGPDGRGDWSPAARPLEPPDLAALQTMLLELMNRWSRHQRLLGILSRYHRDVSRAYLAATGQLDAALQEREVRDDGGATRDHDGESRRRRLSVALSDGGCKIAWPQPVEGQIQTSYAASYPGCGARMSWNLIEALTGLWTGDDWDNNSRGKRVVSVKTHYPHDAGKLVSWDHEIQRALVVIRNPINAIPSFFNHIYEIKHKLPIHSQRAPVDAWIEWRDRLAGGQIEKFGAFVDYWMERFDRLNGDRIVLSYEMLTDDRDGPREALRMRDFFARSVGVEPVDAALTPCIWKAVVKYKAAQAAAAAADGPPERRPGDGRRRLDPNHHDSQRSGPTERPYTRELLEAMSDMISHLIEKWGPRHKRLGHILGGYLEDIISNKVAIENQSPPGHDLQPLPAKTFHIVQVSSPHAKTVLNNLLVGLFDPDADYKKSSIVSITHDFDLLSLYKKERPKYDEVFFVLPLGTDSRSNADKEMCQYNNVLCIEHKELLYDNPLERQAVVNNLSDKFQTRFESFFGPNSLDLQKRQSSLNRLEAMDNAIASVKGQHPGVTDENHNAGTFRGRLYYCGGPKQNVHAGDFKYSTFGLFLVKSLFPDFEGSNIEIQADNKLLNPATPLTKDTLKDATGNDLVIVHSHQHCEVAVKDFPGLQLHINPECYDIHPNHVDNHNGQFTLDYLPPGEKSFILGLHQDTSRSLQVPFCAMRLWYLYTTRQLTDLKRIFDPLFKPKNTREHFLLYSNSRFIGYREKAARALSEIGTIHTAGVCQGFHEAFPSVSGPLSHISNPTKCVPFDHNQRPSSIQPISHQLGTGQTRNNIELFSHYRYVLIMESANVSGFVSENILHAFLSGAVPVYFGSRFVFEIFNPKAFIYFDLDKPQQALSQIQYYEQNPAEYEKMLNEPILAHGQETIENFFSWDDIVGNGRLKYRIRDMMGLG